MNFGEVVCPRCQVEAARRSRRRGIIERWVLPRFSIYPFRCARCDHRFLMSWPRLRPQAASPADACNPAS